MWSLQRSCSLSPAQLGNCLAMLVAVTLLVGLGFWWAGAPFVTAFAGLELLALLVAFALHARHAADGEWLTLSRGRLRLQQRRGADVETLEFDAARLRLASDANGAIELRAGGQVLSIGRLASAARRQQVLNELRTALGFVHERGGE